MWRLPRALLIAVAAAIGALALAASAAFAGSYVVNACSPSSSPGAWGQVNTDPAGFAAGQRCGGPAYGTLGSGDQGALYAQDILNSPLDIPNGALAGWTFTAPPAATITAITYYRALASYGVPDLVAGLFQADGAPLEQCMIGRAFGSSISCSMPNNQIPAAFAGLATSSLFFGVTCRIVDNATACIGGGTIHYAQAQLYSAKVTLSQSVLPTLTQPGGALWGGGVLTGVAAVTFAASDPSGIAQVLVRGDTGQTLASAAQACDYTAVQPCPQLPAGSLAIDTTQLTDGPHTFSILVTDAAANTQLAASPSVIVDNNGPPAPSAFHAAARAGSRAIDVSWTNPPRPPAPLTGAMIELCQASCAPPLSVSPSTASQIAAPSPGAYTLRLWLVDAQGRGGPHNAAITSVTVPSPGSTPPGTTPATNVLHTHIAASLHGRRLHVTAAIAAISRGSVNISWRSRSFGRTLGRASRVVAINNHRVAVTFTLSQRARAGAVRVAVRSGRRIIIGALARPS